MKRLKYFMECYFNQTFGFEDLDKRIVDFKSEAKSIQDELMKEISEVIEKRKYSFLSRFLKNYCDVHFDDLEELEKFINYLYDKLLDRPTRVKAEDFIKKYRVIFCPVCAPDPEVAEVFNLIDKATVIDKNIQIYICKSCKLVWLDENDIRADNAFAYKKFMKANGLKGLWKELKDVDVL